MALDDIVAKVTDPYDRQARLYPALLCVLPMIALVTLLYGPNASALTRVVSIAVSCGGLFLMTNICREMGKRVEAKLYREWGGKPTTRLLRHRDDIIDSVTKRRYHAFLGAKLNFAFPDAEFERIDPAKADEAYQSGARWLLDHTRPDEGKKFDLLFRDNITYGFRRNALGTKPIGIIIAVGCLLWVLARDHVLFGRGGAIMDWTALNQLSAAAVASLAVSGVMLLIWVFFFTKTSLRTSAFSFAETLLRTCDTL
jgi:uncharacterized membrane protein YuzA (DUF378 family)